MYAVTLIVIVIAAVLMCGIVFVQESKGGGLASGFADSNSLLGVRKTTDVVEKTTWWLAGIIVALSVVSVFVLPTATTEMETVVSTEGAPIEQVMPQSSATNASEEKADAKKADAKKDAKEAAAPAAEEAPAAN